MPSQKRLLFLVGLTRSGTSLLYALLNQHPEVALMYEADAVYLDQEPLGPAQFGRMEFWNGVLHRHGLNSANLAGVRDARGFYSAYADPREAAIFGEKSPTYCAHLQRIAARFPDAQFLIIRRDFANVYRSVLDAARDVTWWGRPGAFHRLLREQEVMLRDARLLHARGAAVHSVDYEDLVRDPATVMRGVAEFLRIDFRPELVSLHGADLSAVHSGPEHRHLQQREIGVRQNPTTLPEGRARCIARFQARWDLLEGRPAREGAAAPIGRLEYCWHQALGALVVQFRYLVRMIYEFAPPPALRAYRELKQEVREIPQALRGPLISRRALSDVGVIAGMLAACAAISFFAGPHVTVAPFFLVPVIFAARRLNVAAALVVSLITAVAWSSIHVVGDSFWEQGALVAWNSAMRFLVFALFTMLASADSGYDATSSPARGQ